MTIHAQGTQDFAKVVTDTLTLLVNRAAEALSPTPDRIIQVAPGEMIAWDDNCDGQLWARTTTIAPGGDFVANGMPGAQACNVPFFLWTIELGVIRCAATLDEDGSAPTAAEITADGFQTTSDMAALLGVLRCWENLRTLLQWTPQGPEGGYHGGFWTFTARLPNCLTCEIIEPDTEPPTEPELEP